MDSGQYLRVTAIVNIAHYAMIYFARWAEDLRSVRGSEQSEILSIGAKVGIVAVATLLVYGVFAISRMSKEDRRIAMLASIGINAIAVALLFSAPIRRIVWQ